MKRAGAGAREEQPLTKMRDLGDQGTGQETGIAKWLSYIEARGAEGREAQSNTLVLESSG